MARKNTLYAISAANFQAVKIGITCYRLNARLSSLQTGCPDRLEIFGFLPDASYSQERSIHTLLEDFGFCGEWFQICFETIDALAFEGMTFTERAVDLCVRFGIEKEAADLRDMGSGHWPNVGWRKHPVLLAEVSK
jgi:hypothetical protein